MATLEQLSSPAYELAPAWRFEPPSRPWPASWPNTSARPQQHYEEQQSKRSIAALKRRAAALGFAVMPTPATT